MYFSSNLSYLRMMRRKTQEDMASEIGVSQGAIGNYEAGRREPSLAEVIKIAQILEVSIDDLLTKDLRPAGLQLSNNLKYLRKSNNYTQANIAKLLMISQQSVSFYESGEKRPSYEGLLNLSEFFGVTVDDLLKKDLSKEGKG